MTEAKTPETIDIVRLQELLPHRYPFLLIDRIVEVNGDDFAIGIKNVTMNEPHFTGHFPGNPVMPGVLIIEAMAQTAGAICVNGRPGGVTEPPVVFFMTIDSAKFRRPVVPGDKLELHVTKLKQRGGIFRFACEGRVDGVKVAEAELTAMVSYKDEAKPE